MLYCLVVSVNLCQCAQLCYVTHLMFPPLVNTSEYNVVQLNNTATSVLDIFACQST